jgi:hypothetical protein
MRAQQINRVSCNGLIVLSLLALLAVLHGTRVPGGGAVQSIKTGLGFAISRLNQPQTEKATMWVAFFVYF